MIKHILRFFYWAIAVVLTHSLFLITIKTEYPVVATIIGLTLIAIAAIKYEKPTIRTLNDYFKGL